MDFNEWYDSQPLVLLDRKTEHRLTWEAAIQQQAAEISRLKSVLTKCKEALIYHTEQTRPILRTNEALAAIKEVKHAA